MNLYYSLQWSEHFKNGNIIILKEINKNIKQEKDIRGVKKNFLKIQIESLWEPREPCLPSCPLDPLVEETPNLAGDKTGPKKLPGIGEKPRFMSTNQKLSRNESFH